jgi:diacylglycerol kinase family enzyme
LNDGLLDVVLIGDLTLPEKILFAVKLYQGKVGQVKKVRICRGRRVNIRSRVKVFIEHDLEGY